jgi:hypothetical protein
MCKDHSIVYYGGRVDYDPIEPTTVFSPSDTKAEFLTSVSLNENEIVEWQWYYRNDSSKGWVNCSLPYDERHYTAPSDGDWAVEGHLDIAGYWPGVYYPRAYRVDFYCLNNSFSFSEFFEVTNGGVDSPRVCESVDANGTAVNTKSRFTVGVDTQVCDYLRFDNVAYFNEETGNSHNFTTVWIQPDGTIYKTHSCVFPDYKVTDINRNYWNYALIRDDSIPIDSSTPVGNWRVEVYMDSYLNDTWTPYGPIATTPFIIGNLSVPHWTFMVYLDSDNSLANVTVGYPPQVHDLGVDVFLDLASVNSSSDINIVVQLDRGPSSDVRYGNWTGCKRFNIKNGMTPTPENAVQDLGDVDMGDPNALKDFVNWTINNYPSEHLFLVLWDHGSGCMGVCYDVTSGGDYLSLPKITEAFTGIPAIIDDVLIDACDMSMLEVAYQIKDSANILIGPEGLGYAPAPYNDYLNSLSNNTSMSPNAFAQEIVTDYLHWCYRTPEIQNATMTATDLTKMTSLTATVDDFATTLKEKETLYHEQISSARSMTEGCPGPYAYSNGTYQTGYFIDLYNFTWQIYGNVPDQELKNASDKVMTAIKNAVIKEIDVNDPGTNGLAVFFPDEKGKYVSFAALYGDMAFALETPWDELVKYHLSGFVLTVQTGYPDMPVKVDEDVYNTTAEGEIPVFLQPGTHTVNVTAVFLPEPDSQVVFVQWKDNGNTSNVRTFSLDGTMTVEAEYETQYLLIIEKNFGTTDPPQGRYWCNATYTEKITATPPSTTSGEKYDWVGWAQTDSGNPNTDNPISILVDRPVNVTAEWNHKYSLTVTSSYGNPDPPSGWFEAGKTITESVASPISELSSTQYVCTGWIGNGSIPASGTSAATSFILNTSSSIQWNWKTQYLLTVHTDPNGLNPQPSISPAGSWYDNDTKVTLTAQQINGYAFQQWSTEGASWDVGVNPINITMDEPSDLTAHYVRAQAWWQILVRTDVISAILGLLGTVVTVGLVGGAWFRSRKRRDIVKAFLAEIDDVYSRLRTDPKKCEEELYTLRNTILEGLTEGKMTEDNYAILDNRIDKYVNELAEKQEDKRISGEKRAKGKE